MQEQQAGDNRGSAGSMDALTPEEIAQMLMQALMNADQAMMRALAKQSVQRFAGMEPGRPVGGTYYLYRTLRNLDLDGMLDKMMEQAAQDAGGELTNLEERLERDEFEHRIEKFKNEIEAEIRRRLVADRGVEAMAKTLRKPLPEDVEFMHASRDEMESLQEGVAAADPQARRPPGPQAPPRSQGAARLPQHRAPLAQLRRRAGRAEVQVPAPGQARADGGRRHLRLGRCVRPLHADARLRDPGSVLQGPLVRVHRRHRRGHRVLPVDRGHHRKRSTG